MQIDTLLEPQPTKAVIRLTGRFDAHEVDSFREVVESTLETGPPFVDVHLADVEFVDSMALAELIRALRLCRENGGDLIIASISDPVRVILELTKLNSAFTIL